MNRNTRIILLAALLVTVIIAAAIWQTSDQPDNTSSEIAVPSPSPSPSLINPNPSPAPSVEPEEPVIELPNRPSTPPSLTTNCGGAYPTVYFRSTTNQGVHVICADSAGASYLTYVGRETGSDEIRVIKANYAYESDTFVAVQGNLTIRVAGYDGQVSFYRDGALIRTEDAIELWQFPEVDD